MVFLLQKNVTFYKIKQTTYRLSVFTQLLKVVLYNSSYEYSVFKVIYISCVDIGKTFVHLSHNNRTVDCTCVYKHHSILQLALRR